MLKISIDCSHFDPVQFTSPSSVLPEQKHLCCSDRAVALLQEQLTGARNGTSPKMPIHWVSADHWNTEICSHSADGNIWCCKAEHHNLYVSSHIDPVSALLVKSVSQEKPG